MTSTALTAFAGEPSMIFELTVRWTWIFRFASGIRQMRVFLKKMLVFSLKASSLSGSFEMSVVIGPV